jgi:DNA-binding IclR family transcriptional regulator
VEKVRQTDYKSQKKARPRIFPRQSESGAATIEMSEKSENVRAIDRAIDVLECFAADRHSLSIGEIEKRARLSRPTLYRILSTLMRRGFVRKNGDPPRYRLGVGVGRLADARSNSLDIVRLATPLLEDLRERHDETVALYLRKDNTRLCVAELPTRRRCRTRAGSDIPGA